jgi:organic radical activating enzyme
MAELPIMEYGCDSDYSVSAKYKHLATDYTEETLADEIYRLLPRNTFLPHPDTGQTIDLCITGGEPMMQQRSIVALLKVMIDRGDFPTRIQIETNGSIAPTNEFKDFVEMYQEQLMCQVCFNISPKLLYVSGEENGVDVDIISQLIDIGSTADLKFVMNNNDNAWEELADVVEEIVDYTSTYGVNIYVMPMGATKEQQESIETKQIVYRALNNGYNISGRLHAHILGNGMGT